MPKVKAAKGKKPARAKAQGGRLAGFIERYALAGAAGAVVIAIVGVFVMWAGGYVGLLAERVDASVREASVRSGFEIKRVTLKGREQSSVEDIERAMGPAVGESILHFDLGEARRRVENIGWVKAASVSRLLPNTIHVSVRERAPAAVWQMSGQLHLVDASGAVIRSVKADEYADLPLVVGAGAPEAAADILNELASRPALGDQISSLTRMGDRRWNLRLRAGVDVYLPEGDVSEALDILVKLQETGGTLDQALKHIDLRDPERLTAHLESEGPPPAD
ncbi:MAG: cell division protein FtsQ/DivIB [Parvularculaceae bacterium]